ncbi:phosphotransferase [Nakamurella alba]|uniref:phosphotransferase n=1 Tax=Nakamurella alba TaxID=2665158 RepID=UPI0018ABE0C1|nr:choline/ethanolamine kinase family protein [Nakamurella alba]
MDEALLQRLDAVPLLATPDRVVSELTGGLTNRNLRVDLPGTSAVARLSDPTGALLAIDRTAEDHNSRAAASTGIAPDVLDFRPDDGVLVVRFVPGRTLTEADVRDPAMLPRIAAAVRTLHSAPPFLGTFDMAVRQREYLSTCVRLGLPLPAGYTDHLDTCAEVVRVLALDPPPAVPCHNDLLAANFIDDGGRLWIIDYEYAGTGDPSFEIGNIAGESLLDDDAADALAIAYFGTADPRMPARCRLQTLLARYGWTLWGVIRQHAMTPAVDLTEWTMDKYERAVRTFTATALPSLLRAAAGAGP